MSEEELIETLRAFEKNRVEQLEEPAKNLFYAIMEIADERDRLNNIIDKAIKYIEDTSYKSYFSMLQADYNMSLDTLINILKGVDKE